MADELTARLLTDDALVHMQREYTSHQIDRPTRLSFHTAILQELSLAVDRYEEARQHLRRLLFLLDSSDAGFLG